MRVLLLAALTTTLLAAAVAPVSAGWSEQRIASPAGADFEAPALAANVRGDAAVVWRTKRVRFLAVRPAGRARFGRRIALPGRGARHRVAVLPDGTVLVGWLSLDGTSRRARGTGRHDCCRKAFLQRLRPGSRRLTAPRLATARGTTLDAWSLAGGPGGRAALIGNSGVLGVDRRVQWGGVMLATSRRGGVFATPVAPSGESYRYRAPFVGFGGDGRGVALWLAGSGGGSLVGAPIRADGRVGATVTHLAAPADGPRLDILGFDAGLDRSSRLTAIWTARAPRAIWNTQVTVATADVTGRLAGRQLLDDTRAANDSVLDVAPSGDAIAVWDRYGDGGRQVTGLAIRRTARGRFRVLAPLPGPSGALAAILSSGHGVVVYGSRSVIARSVAPDGRIGPIRRLGGMPDFLGARRVAAARTAGRVTLAWTTRDGLRVANYRP